MLCPICNLRRGEICDANLSEIVVKSLINDTSISILVETKEILVRRLVYAGAILGVAMMRSVLNAYSMVEDDEWRMSVKILCTIYRVQS